MAEFEEPCIVWRKSTASNSGACVEVAVAGRAVLVRDSANGGGPVLGFTVAAWSTFLVKTHSTDLGPGTGLA